MCPMMCVDHVESVPKPDHPTTFPSSSQKMQVEPSQPQTSTLPSTTERKCKQTVRFEEIERVQRQLHEYLMTTLPQDTKAWHDSMDAINRAQVESCNDKASTVFMLDWDDTCCATSWLSVGNGEFVVEGDDGWMEVLEQRVLGLMKKAVKRGRIVIVTNAGEGWVQLSSKKWLPAVGEFLRDYRRVIKVVSARERYERICGSDVAWQWKQNTFYDELVHIERLEPVGRGRNRNVIVLGDSVADQYAAHAACAKLRDEGLETTLKVVKFLDQPSIEQLCKELTVLLEQLDAMVAYRTAFDVAMYKEPLKARPACEIDRQSEALTP